METSAWYLYSLAHLSEPSCNWAKKSLEIPRKAVPAKDIQETLLRSLNRFPRSKLAVLPTPLVFLEQLSSEFGLNLWMKRDDLTSLGGGGNKVRKLEYVMGDALARGAKSVITWGGIQSNWCQLTAAAASRLDLKSVLVLFKGPGLPSAYDGNLLLDTLFGAELHLIEYEPNRDTVQFESVRDLLEPLAQHRRELGDRPYIAPLGGSLCGGSMQKPLGTIAYVTALVELLDQSRSQGFQIDSIVAATGSGSTQAGLMVGAKLADPKIKIVGINVSSPLEKMRRNIFSMAWQTFLELGWEVSFHEDEVILLDHVGAGHGLVNQDSLSAMQLAATKEGILLDPVYTAKAFDGLRELVQSGFFRRNENVVFLHSGGTTAIYPYREELTRYLHRGVVPGIE